MTSSQQGRHPDSELVPSDNRRMNCDEGGPTDDTIKHVNDQQMDLNGLKDDQHNVKNDGSKKQKEGWTTY